MFSIIVDDNMSYKLMAIYFVTSHFRPQKNALPESVNEEKPTYKKVKYVTNPLETV